MKRKLLSKNKNSLLLLFVISSGFFTSLYTQTKRSIASSGSFSKAVFQFVAKLKFKLHLKTMTFLFIFIPVFVNSAFGQITQPLAWTKAYDQPTATGTGTSFSVTAGTNRILVVGITTTFDDNNGSNKQADPTTVTYGGVPLTKATGNGTTTKGRMHTWLYYLKDDVVMDGTIRPLKVTTGSTNGSTLANMTVWYGVYAGVDQTPATYTTGDNLDNGGASGPAKLSAAMAVNANEQAIYVSSIYNDTNATIPSYTINANWTSGGSNTGTNTSGGGTPVTVAWKVQVANRTIPVANTTDNAATSAITPTGTIRYAMSAMSLPKASLPPTISSFTPSSGCASTTPVVITGTNFTGATAVTFGGTNALSFIVNSSTQITATPATGTTGTIKVTTSGGADTSVTSFTVNPLPTAAGIITGTATVCQGQANVSYSVSTITNATSYTWVYTGVGATITGTTSTSTITFASNATSGNLTVYGVNACGNGTISANYAITVNASLTPVATITPATCSNGSDGAVTISGLVPIEFQKSDNDNINLGSSFLSTRGAFTIEGWVKFNIADVGSRMSLFGQNDAIEFFLDTNTITLWTPGGGSASAPLTAAIGNNAWHHFAATGNGINIKIYIDGVLVATGGSATSNYGSSTYNTEIGSGVVDPLTPTGGGFTGQIEKVGFYNTTLSAGTIASLAVSPTTYLGTESGLIAGYNFFEGAGTTLSSLPAGKNGTFGNSPQWVYTFAWTKTGTPTYTASTKSISGLSPGQYNLSILGASCPSTTSYTVGYTNTAPAITAMTATACSATAFTVTPVDGTNGVVPAGTTYTWSAPALSPLASITGGSAQATGQATISQTLTNTTTAVATATYTVTPLSGSCTGSTFTVTVTITPTVPPTATKTDATCALATGSITITSPVPAAGITFTVTGTSPVVAAVTNTTGVFSGLAVGTYIYSVANSGCSISGASSVTISPLLSNIWTTSWSLGTPTVDQDLDFQGNYTSSTDVEGCSCKVNSGAAVVFTSGNTLKITNEVKVIGLGSPGTLTFENNASLVQINDAAVNKNKGDIIYMRKTNSVRSSDYTYWSSPVAGQLLKDVSPSYTSGMFYSFNATIGNWVSEATSNLNVMEVGKGYIIRGPQSNLSPAPYDASFIGIPNNGTVTTLIGATGTSNLIGNPYPSAIDADAFLNANSTVLEGTIYFWTHNTAIQLSNTGTAYVYTSNDYASYNLTGGVRIALAAPSGSTGGLNTTEPLGKIAAGQSFFSTSKVAGTATFNNSMRVTGGALGVNNSQFFKTGNTKAKTANTIEKHRLWLDLSNSEGAFKQTLVGYVTGATNGYDSRFDGESFDGNQFVDFYSVNQDKKLTIQGRALPFEVADTVPLGYRTTIEGTFTINIDQADGLLAGQAVFIEDKLNNTVFDLKSGDYTFTTVKGTFNDRFVLRYTNKTLGTKDFITHENQVLVSNINKQIKINSDVETIDKVQVYDLSGKQIYQKTNVNSNELSIPNLVSSHQVLVVKTILQNGQTVTRKIIY